MKKLFYVTLIILVTGFTLTSCTEETVAPSNELNGGGGASDPVVA